MFVKVDDIDKLAMEMKLIAVSKPLDTQSSYSKTIPEAISNAFRPEVITELMKHNCNRAIIWRGKAITLCLTVELDESEKRIWHLSMGLVQPFDIVPQQVPEEEAQIIFKAFFSDKEYKQSESKGAFVNIRHYHLPYEHETHA